MSYEYGGDQDGTRAEGDATGLLAQFLVGGSPRWLGEQVERACARIEREE